MIAYIAKCYVCSIRSTLYNVRIFINISQKTSKCVVRCKFSYKCFMQT